MSSQRLIHGCLVLALCGAARPGAALATDPCCYNVCSTSQGTMCPPPPPCYCPPSGLESNDVLALPPAPPSDGVTFTHAWAHGAANNEELMDRTCGGDGSITSRVEFTVPIQRYLGPTDANHHLPLAELIQRYWHYGVLARHARLTITFRAVHPGVSQVASLPWPAAATVTVNGVRAGLVAADVPALPPQGGVNDGRWQRVTFDIGVEHLEFPDQLGVGGNLPTPQYNRIVVDVTDLFSDVCLFVADGSIRIYAMSPVVLVHGIGGDSASWETLGFAGALRDKGLVSFALDFPDPWGNVEGNSTKLKQFAWESATAAGCTLLNVVCHSKGGLDARRCIREHGFALVEEGTSGWPGLVSFVTISTPHNGSPLADLATGLHDAWIEAGGHRLPLGEEGLPIDVVRATGDFAKPYQQKMPGGWADLSMDVTNKQNREDLDSISAFFADGGVLVGTLGADADRNDNTMIQFGFFGREDEIGDFVRGYGPFTQLLAQSLAAPVIESVLTQTYVLLRACNRVQVSRAERQRVYLGTEGFYWTTVTRAESVLLAVPLELNDCLVQASSARGDSGFRRFTDSGHAFTGVGTVGGRNHSGVLRAEYAERVFPWLKEGDLQAGGLKGQP